MNASPAPSMPARHSPSAQAQPPLNMPDDVASRLSASVDGELQQTEWDALMADTHGPETLETWHRYHVIGDVLRGTVPPLGRQSPQDFLAAVRSGLSADPAVPDEAPRSLTAPVQPMPVQPIPGKAQAANDPVFRWKLLASLASLSTVLAVVWSVWGTAAPEGDAGQWAASGQPAVATAPETAVLVSSPQGMVLRDAQLERLMAEHRQHGAVSALQVPAGFVRNATYDVAGR